MTLNDYLCRRAGNEPDAMIIHGTPRTVYRDYKGRGVLVAVGPDTYDVVRATTETDIETLYTRGDYERWRWDGENLHRIDVAAGLVMAGPIDDLPDPRTAAHRLIVTPETLRRAEALGFVPGEDDVLEWALRAAEGWREERQRADAAAMALAEGASRFQDERDAARQELADFMRDVRRRHEDRAVNLAYCADRLASLDADVLRALVVATAKELDDTYAAFDRAVSSSIRADLQGAEVRDELVRVTSERDRLFAERTGEVWMWNGDGSDDPDSLSCPVLMTADQVRELVAERNAAAAHVAICPDCGEVETCDEDRCCASCGRDLLVFADRHSAELYQEAQQAHADAIATLRMRVAEVHEVLCSDADETELRASVAALCYSVRGHGDDR